jgi:hypothetical protein
MDAAMTAIALIFFMKLPRNGILAERKIDDA